MSPLTSFFLRLIREDNHRERRLAVRRRTVAGRGWNAAGRGRHAAGRGQNVVGGVTQRGDRGQRTAAGLRAAAHPPVGLDPWLLAGPAAPMLRADPSSPPPPPEAWLPPWTPTHGAATAGPSRSPPGYTPVPMRSEVDVEEALAFISAPTGASGVVRLGAGMEASPQQEMATDPGSRAERRFGRLFGRTVAAIDRRPGRHAGSWAPTSLGLGAARQDPVVVAPLRTRKGPPGGAVDSRSCGASRRPSLRPPPADSSMALWHGGEGETRWRKR
ncbi:hypothetical protein ZWY2020_044103 [Hordeum vulgare]|nr:hypothetical protein ZWY2020_044103 [Hordeum vulgare]